MYSNPRVSGTVLVVLICLTLSSAAAAEFVGGWLDFCEYRYTSALPGNLFGVTPEGQAGFAGAFLQNVPVAFTPSRGNYILGASAGSHDRDLRLKLWGDGVDGTGFVAAGLGDPGRGVYLSNMYVGHKGENAFHLQHSLWTDFGRQMSFAVGVLDILDMRQSYCPEPHGARSFYAVASGVFPETHRPVYWTLGYGNGRFNNRPFGGLSLELSNHWKTLLEFDGFNTNWGLAWGLHGTQTDQNWDLIGFFGYANLERPMFGFTTTFH